MFLSSHSLDVVEELADRIAIVDHGRLIACGTLEALREQAAVGRLARRRVPDADAADEDNDPVRTSRPCSPVLGGEGR